MTDFKALLAQAKLPETTVPICLRADLTAEHEAAERELEQAQATPASSLAGSGVGDLVDRIRALEAEMQQTTYTFRLRALPRPAFRELVNAHPPRKGDDGAPLAADQQMGINSATFFDALIRACVYDPEPTEDEWADLLDAKLTSRQFDMLSNAAWYLNRGDIDVPFSRAASLAIRNTAGE